MEDIMDLPLRGEVEAVDTGVDYFSDVEWSESLGSELGVWV
jgi:hypothetical protein